ncbi:CoA transferase [Solimonas soli]|uniref:CoA transferase n=1 Tax=Solimonas soli TaxID=413479 RepID=UPI0004B488DE|nr:CoA transferase [Solimonas soli]
MSAPRDAAAPGAAYRDALLASLGVAASAPAPVPDEHPALACAASGLMALSGQADGPPLMCPVPLATLADGALAALATLAPQADFADLRGARLLGERAALTGLRRQGARSAGGACRLLDAADGAFALSLARDDDWSLLPAWLEDDAADWDRVARLVRTRHRDELVARGRLLGLAVAPGVDAPHERTAWFELPRGDAHFAMKPARPPRVVDLSSLWAGPLCTQLLQRCGAEVIKCESTTRPDGARQGPAAFFDLLNAGKRSVALELHTPRGRAQLRELLLRADIVIEASRPRALRQMGIEAEALLRENAGLTWVSLTGYGRAEPQAQWIAYGDDAGVAAGLSEILYRASGARVFVGDAIADPLTGLHAALAAWASHRAGGGRLLALALRDVARHVAQFDRPRDDEALRARQREWTACVAGLEAGLPPARAARGTAAALGADTTRVLQGWGIAC